MLGLKLIHVCKRGYWAWTMHTVMSRFVDKNMHIIRLRFFLLFIFCWYLLYSHVIFLISFYVASHVLEQWYGCRNAREIIMKDMDICTIKRNEFWGVCCFVYLFYFLVVKYVLIFPYKLIAYSCVNEISDCIVKYQIALTQYYKTFAIHSNIIANGLRCVIFSYARFQYAPVEKYLKIWKFSWTILQQSKMGAVSRAQLTFRMFTFRHKNFL